MKPSLAVWLLPLGLAAVLVGDVMWTWALRLPHPYDLEWMEGGMLAHAWRLQQGLPLYPEPGPEWIPYIYPPGYPALLAALGAGGLSHALGRAVSLAGTLLACGSLVALVGRHGVGPQRWLAAACVPAILLGTYGATGAFLDLVRPDALALGLLLLALVLSLERRPGLQIAGGLVLALAFLVKHHTAAFGLPLVVGLWARDRAWGPPLRVGLAALVPAGLATLALEASTGTFLDYLVAVPASHGVKTSRMWPGTPYEWASALPFAGVLVGLGALLPAAWALEGRRRTHALAISGLVAVGLAVGVGPSSTGTISTPLDRPWTSLLQAVGLGRGAPDGLVLGGPAEVALGLAGLGAAAVGLGILLLRLPSGAAGRGWTLAGALGLVALGVSAWMRGHVGGFVNVHLPLYALTAAGAGLAAAWLAARPWGRGWVGPSVAAALLAAQIGTAWVGLDTARLVPTAADRAAGDRVVARLRELPGPVWSPVSPWLPVQAGHEPGPPLIALWDVDHLGGPFGGVRARFVDAVEAHRWAVIVDGERPLPYGIPEHYRVLDPLRLGRALRPRTGWRNRPARLLVPASGGGDDGDGERPRR